MWPSSPRGEMDATKQFHHQAWNFGYFFTLIWKLKSKKSGVVDGGGSMASMESDISFMMKVGKPEEKAAFKSRKKKKKSHHEKTPRLHFQFTHTFTTWSTAIMWPLTLAGGPPLLLFCLFRVNNLTAVARQQWNLKLSSAAEPRFISTSSSSKSQSGASPKIAPFCHIKLSLACLKWLMLYRLFPNNGEGVVGGKNDYLRRLHFRPPTGGEKTCKFSVWMLTVSYWKVK